MLFFSVRAFVVVISLSAAPFCVIAQDAIVLARGLVFSESRLIPSNTERIRVPKKVDPSADARLIEAAAELEKTDGALSELRVDEKYSRAQLEAFAMARNVAMDNLVFGRQILTGTAGGEFPRNSQSAIVDMLAAIKMGLSEPKGRDAVATEITYKEKDNSKFSIEYQTYSDFNAKLDQWSTYQISQTLSVGTYNFRVTLERGKRCTELVAILSHPTKRAICGRLAP